MFMIFVDIIETAAISGIMRHNVTGLRPYSQYQVRMRAENDYGTSTPSLPSGIFIILYVFTYRAVRGDVKINWLQPPYSTASCSQLI